MHSKIHKNRRDQIYTIYASASLFHGCYNNAIMTNENRLGQGGKLPEYLSDLVRHPPADWDNPQVKVVATLIEQSGILPQMTVRNPELPARVTDFLIGQRTVLIVGGESGMGKSLISADLRKMHGDLQLILPEQLQTELAVISWDRTHMAFFEEVSTEAGETIPLPTGETHVAGRRIVSSVLGDQIRFIRKYISSNVRILLEAPLIDVRGETVFRELGEYRGEVQTFIMHSPKTRFETLQKGRLMETSGQRDSMQSIREKLLDTILGGTRINIPLEEQDEKIKHWWIQQLEEWGGMVVEWDPDDNREGLNNSVATYIQMGIKSDVLSPKGLSRFTRSQLESIFRTITDMDQFLRIFTS